LAERAKAAQRIQHGAKSTLTPQVLGRAGVFRSAQRHEKWYSVEHHRLRTVENADEATSKEVTSVFCLQHYLLIGRRHFPAAATACIEQ
jgi:hypothetical protein